MNIISYLFRRHPGRVCEYDPCHRVETRRPGQTPVIGEILWRPSPHNLLAFAPKKHLGEVGRAPRNPWIQFDPWPRGIKNPEQLVEEGEAGVRGARLGELEADGEDGDSGLELDGLLVGVELGVVVDELDLEGGAGEKYGWLLNFFFLGNFYVLGKLRVFMLPLSER